MVTVEALGARKRLRSPYVEQLPPAKKKKTSTKDCYRPPPFWDTLSTIWLTRGALGEFERRNITTTRRLNYIPSPAVEAPTGSVALRLKRFARRGGPGLSHLRGVAGFASSVTGTMNQQPTRDRKRPSTGALGASTNMTQTKTKWSPYDRNFGQKMVDIGVYPFLHNHPDGRPDQTPVNLEEIEQRLTVRRPSLSPSRITNADFKTFQRTNQTAVREASVVSKVIAPMIVGGETGHCSEYDQTFTKIKELGTEFTQPKPDIYYGAPPSAIHLSIRADIGPHILPCGDTNVPAAPNYFFEAKGPSGSSSVGENQVLHYGAHGARAMHALQNYGATRPIFDGKAYSFSSLYDQVSGVLHIYATHITEHPSPGGKLEYHQNLVFSQSMLGRKEDFVRAVTAYRNARDLAKEQRDILIAQANEVAARQMVAVSPPTQPPVGKPGDTGDQAHGGISSSAGEEIG